MSPLRSIADRITIVSKGCQDIWFESPQPPCPLPKPQIRPEERSMKQSSTSNSFGSPDESNYTPSDLNMQAEGSGSWTSAPANIETDVAEIGASTDPSAAPSLLPSIENLKARGSSQYTCPYGMACEKGGVQNGQLRVFKRNSDFR
jgi:hypothetical protein